VKEHLRDKVFLGGGSMLISVMYLVLESGGCVASHIGDNTERVREQAWSEQGHIRITNDPPLIASLLADAKRP